MKTLRFFIIAALIAIFAMPSLAQEATLNTITVTGTGQAYGSPDVANIQIGVEKLNEELSVAFADVNNTMDTVIQALIDAGVAREDIRTAGLNVYQDRGYPGPDGQMSTPMFTVSNQLQVVVRDVTTVGAVLDAALNAGANNIFGLDFSIADTKALESTARAEAIADARARAEELANLIGAQLGNAIVVEEAGGGYMPMFDMAQSERGLGGGGATVEPGQRAVSVQLRVTFEIVR